MNVRLGDRYVNPLNVTIIEPVEVEKTVTETVNGKEQKSTETVPAVDIRCIGDDGIRLEGVAIEDVVNELNIGLNATIVTDKKQDDNIDNG